jgi:CO/xanthine dehydrogenase FAD-binding subunit
VSVLLPASRAEAVAALADHPGAVPVAGGTDLLVHWPAQVARRDGLYLDLSGAADLRPHRWTDAALVLGALTTYWDVIRDPRAAAEFPLLVAAAREVGAVQIQARGTWAGNVMNASPAADGVPALMACDAVVVLESHEGVEEVPLDSFYTGYKTMRRGRDQLLTAIRVPRGERDVQVFEKVGTRRAQAIAKLGLAAARGPGGWRVVAASVAPTVRRCATIERLLAERRPVAGPDDLLPALDADVAPIDDIRSTTAYRRTTLARVMHHALREHWGRA